jgi:hypothetical protein
MSAFKGKADIRDPRFTATFSELPVVECKYRIAGLAKGLLERAQAH